MIQYTNCKINIGLHILSRRDDGYHDIETLFYPVRFMNDAVEVLFSDDESDHVYVTGLAIDEPMEKNLCYKAVQLLRQKYTFPPVSVHLHKIVPMGAGLGGGSADATATLVLINRLFELGITNQQLLRYSARLGSDCAFFVSSTPQLGEGRGEVLSPVNVDLTGKYLMIVKPDIHVSTAEAYQRVKPNSQRISLSKLAELPLEEWKDVVVNDFEESIFKTYPQIAILKEQLYQHGAVYAQMSGSGAACYGIFDRQPEKIEVPKEWDVFVGEL